MVTEASDMLKMFFYEAQHGAFASVGERNKIYVPPAHMKNDAPELCPHCPYTYPACVEECGFGYELSKKLKKMFKKW